EGGEDGGGQHALGALDRRGGAGAPGEGGAEGGGVEAAGGRRQVGPRGRPTEPGGRRPGDDLGTAPHAHEGVDVACRASSSRTSRRPAVFRLAMTRPGVTSPRSHSIQCSSSLFGSV